MVHHPMNFFIAFRIPTKELLNYFDVSLGFSESEVDCTCPHKHTCKTLLIEIDFTIEMQSRLLHVRLKLFLVYS